MTCAENSSQLLSARSRVVQLNIGPIERQPLHCYADSHWNNVALPGEYVDMLLRRVADDLSSYDFLTTREMAFDMVVQLIKQHTHLSSLNCFKLANLYCQIQFGFQMKMSRYLLTKVFKVID